MGYVPVADVAYSDFFVFDDGFVAAFDDACDKLPCGAFIDLVFALVAGAPGSFNVFLTFLRRQRVGS